MAQLIPSLLHHIETSSGLTASEAQRTLTRQLTRVTYETLRRQWLRWSSGQTVPGVQQLHDIVVAARQRGWLREPKGEGAMGLKQLLDVIESEGGRLVDADLERARAAMAPDAIRIAASIERLAESSVQSWETALPAAILEVTSMVIDRVQARLAPGNSLIARAMAAGIERALTAAAQDGARVMRTAAETLEAEEAEILVGRQEELARRQRRQPPLMLRPKRLRQRRR